MENVLDGKLEYLKMVKGQGDMTYLRLKDRFDRLVAQSDAKVIKSWAWNDFEGEKGVKLIIKTSPTSQKKYVDFPSKDKTQRYFLPPSCDTSNLEQLQIEMIQKGEEVFYCVSEKDKEPIFLL